MTTIYGQDDAWRIINAALGSGRIHHAWIFCGPKGVGKFTSAVEFARILLTAAARNPQGDRTSRLIDAESHPDLHVIRKELALFSDDAQVRDKKLTNIPLDVLRERVIGDRTHEAPAYRTPVEGTRKVFIIDEAELIDRTGQNALLKTLEEPPQETYFVLVTSRPQRLLPTILSRSQLVRFRRLSPEAMNEWLEQTDLDVTAAQQQWIESVCDGSPGTATLAADYGLHEWESALSPMIDAARHGRFDPDFGPTMAKLADEFAQQWVKKNKNASKDSANKDGARHLLSLLGTRVRGELAAAAERGDDLQPWIRITGLLPDAERHLEANVNMKHLFENLAVQWVGVLQD